jgi:ATP-dependent RNA helicase DeaD
MNGDIPQSHRERTVRALKDGRINILVATDVAARGLDIDRISHVINYDMPHDTEAYVHRIGRTGRAGRDGDAILFVMPNQKRKLKAIERETGTRIKYTDIPGIAKINEARGRRFKQRLSDAAATAKLDEYRQLIEELQEESDLSAIDIAAAAAQMANGERPLFMDPSQERENHRRRSDRPEHKRAERGHSFEERKKKEAVKRRREPVADERVRTAPVERRSTPESGMEKFRIEVGRQHGVNPGNIVGAIANEAGLDTEYIGHINIYDDYSTVDLPEGMPKTTLKHLRRVWVAGRKMNISRAYHKKNREKAASHEEAEATVEPAKKQSRKPRKKDRHRDRQPAPGGFRARKKK